MKDKKSLFQISSELTILESNIEDAGGEITPETEKALEISEKELQEKSLNYVTYIHKLEADQELAKIYKLKAEHVIKQKQKLIDRLKANLSVAVETFGDIEVDIFTLKNRKSTSLVITEDAKIPILYHTYEQVISFDKAKLKKDLIAGKEIKGCKLVTKQNIQI